MLSNVLYPELTPYVLGYQTRLGEKPQGSHFCEVRILGELLGFGGDEQKLRCPERIGMECWDSLGHYHTLRVMSSSYMTKYLIHTKQCCSQLKTRESGGGGHCGRCQLCGLLLYLRDFRCNELSKQVAINRILQLVVRNYWVTLFINLLHLY